MTAISKALGGGVLACGLLCGSQAMGADQVSPNAMINLVRLLVKQGVISQKNGDAVLKEAELEAQQARAQTAAQAAVPAAPPPPAPGSLRVPYVPEIVKNQIRDDVKKEVLQQARAENWAQPDAIPQWTKHITLSGDFRFRDEFDMLPSSNDDQVVDYASFNANGPTDVNSVTNQGGIPVLNTTRNRIDRLSLRARLGVDAVITDGVLVGLRLASGGDNGPVSTTQLLGGGLGKKDFWLDQAYLKLEPSHWFAFTAGRMADPFFHSDLVYDPDLNFDGATAALETARAGEMGLNFFVTEGMFPLEYIGGNFPNDSTNKAGDSQKWLWGNQVGLNWKADSFDWRFATSYYDFIGTQGQLSAPCALYLGDKQCSTDPSRPAFMQKGNTLFLIRQILLDPNDPNGTPQPQFAGLDFKYQLINATNEFSMPVGAYRFVFDFDYVHNLAYRWAIACRNAPFALPITNIVPGSGGSFDVCDGPAGTRAKLKSGSDGFYVNTTFGDPQPRSPWAWNVSLGYKYLEPDAVPDAYTDSEFHLGGTNARGFILGGSLGLFKDTWLTARWLSASEVYGSPMAIDVVQLDLNAGF